MQGKGPIWECVALGLSRGGIKEMQRASEVPLFLHNRPRQDTGHLGPRYIFRFRAIWPQLQYIRLCHIQISGQMQTPKVFLLLSCILHQYRTSAKAFSVQDPPQGRFKEIVLWKGANPTKLCFSVKFWRDRISGRSYFNVFWTKTPVFCLIIVTCKSFVSSHLWYLGRPGVNFTLYATNSAPLPLNQ